VLKGDGKLLVRTSEASKAHEDLLVMKSLVATFWNNERGATAIEYALIAVGLSIVIVAAVNSIGTTLSATFTSIAAGFN
jgi:pilus assembly protein Flp/PilA